VDSRGQPDHWGACAIHDTAEVKQACSGDPWLRKTPELFGPEKIIMYNPCNYVSNVAYYHATNRVCTYPDFASGQDYQKALKRSFASLTVGSAMLHGSFTYVGKTFDRQMIKVIAYLAHQISTQNIPCEGDCNPHVLKELSTVKRNSTSIEFLDELTKTFKDQPVPEWADVLDHGDYPKSEFLIFACIIVTIVHVLLPDFVADKVTHALTSAILKDDDYDFAYNQYSPQVAASLADVKSRIPHEELIMIVRRLAGMGMKIAYAFAFQEEMVKLPFLWKPVPNEIGALLLPTWNKLASDLSGVPQLDEYVNQSMDVYPGDSKCRGYSPHALWHEESASGLLELVLLADYINGVVIKYSQ